MAAIDHSHKNQGLFPKNSIFFSCALVHLGQGMRTDLEQTAEPKRSSADIGTSVFPFAFPWYFPYAFPLSEQRGVCERARVLVCLSVCEFVEAKNHYWLSQIAWTFQNWLYFDVLQCSGLMQSICAVAERILPSACVPSQQLETRFWFLSPTY